MHPSIIRQINAARIFHAIRQRPNMSQREISEMTGSDKSTVSMVIKDFEAAGLIERTSRKSDSRPGRPGECISISTRGGLLVGVHPNPDDIQYVVAGLDGVPLHTITRPLPRDPARLGKEIAIAIRKATADISRSAKEVRAVGISIPGLVSDHELLAQSPNLHWNDVHLGKLLQEALGIPFYIDNNANASAIAEFYFGRGTETGDFAYVESGSGVGAGLFLDGTIYRGVHGFAGEFGHMKIVPQGRLCRCGSLGCISAYTSDYAIIQRLKLKDIKVDSQDEILQLAKEQNPHVLSALDEAGRHLGIGLANLVNLLNVPLLVLGGGFDVLAPFMRRGIEESLREMALPSVLKDARVEQSKLGASAVPLGGIALALEGCTSHNNTEASPW
ncbi:ROK family transcriptional regulator (plasmid) [Agrobacterium tumefaciens]|uniref:ROK family transcriptional regulator n=2 Tax=Agrobacterium tumefaciens TaxID=358 RepID=A0AAP9J9F3_AGRTU|nr:ROK family transcriptional regulator [Agrobacterium tumefaciens]NSZ61177.1 ROK family transcriptional regulator [Agrobacterium tumefaciens]QDY97588.1 ROK family transcriptional regulator [Agrobacterium tumefaciens]UXS12715.1 ROK family transcriptional regulator [Agrobacterium tumefaciens]UXS20077.1 ROK family transcriptional regulator [Agrobacterium tumefaciens]UXS27725.1 ROK family transcriptional regulator [Agrobacterium tumefaciens]